MLLSAAAVALLPCCALSTPTLWGDEEELHAMLGQRNSSSKAIVFTLAGSGAIGSIDGSGKDAAFWGPTDLTLLPNSRAFIVTDSRNHKIRVVTIPTAAAAAARRNHNEEPFQIKDANPWLDGVPTVTTLAGSGVRGYKDGIGTEANFNLPTGIAVHPAGAWVAVAGMCALQPISFVLFACSFVAATDGLRTPQTKPTT
jgi:hypothetical protein